MSKEIIEAKMGDLAVPDFITKDITTAKAQGFEEADKDSFAVPFLTIVQKLSPILREVKTLKEGEILDSLTLESFDDVEVVPCAFQRRFIQWGDRKKGGGFKASYTADEILRDNVLKDFDRETKTNAEGDTLVDTRMHYVLYKSDKTSDWTPAIVSFSSTQVKKSKRWMYLMQSKKAKNQDGVLISLPTFSKIYTLSTVEESNAVNFWFGWEIKESETVMTKELYMKSKQFNATITAGEIIPNHAEMDQTEEKIQKVVF